MISLIATFLGIYLNTSLLLRDGLARSLKTFEFYSVSIIDSTESPPSIDLNISFVLRNLADFPITVKLINVLFHVDNEIIGSATPSSEGLTFVLPAKQKLTLKFICHITDSKIIEIVENPPYHLSGNAKIIGYARYLFVTESHTILLNFFQTVQS